MQSGTVKSFSNSKGFGFILPDTTDEELFFHFSAIQMDGFRTLSAGQRVQFGTAPSPKGTHAINIRITDD